MSKTSSLHKPEVFAVHSYETADSHHSVHFGRNFNNPKNTKRFKKWKDALAFAKKKGQQMGLLYKPHYKIVKTKITKLTPLDKKRDKNLKGYSYHISTTITEK